MNATELLGILLSRHPNTLVRERHRPALRLFLTI